MHPLPDRPDRRERLHLKLVVDIPTAEVVQDRDVMTAIRQVKRCRPATESVAAKDQNAHSKLPLRCAGARKPSVPNPGVRTAGQGASQSVTFGLIVANRVMASRCAVSLPAH